MHELIATATADMLAVSNEDMPHKAAFAPFGPQHVAVKIVWRRTGPGRFRGQLGYRLLHRWTPIR